MTTSDIRARILAVLVGVALFLFVAFVPPLWFEDSELLLFLFYIATYSLAGFVMGFIWPNNGWRLGLYLFAIWPPMLLFAAFLSGEQPWHVKAELMSLLGYLLILVGACVGAWLGAYIARRASTKTSTAGEGFS